MTDLIEAKAAIASSEIAVKPLSGHTGAEIFGINISKPLTDVEQHVVQSALDKWKVVFFRDQHIGHAEQIAFTRQFGDLTYAHPHDDNPPEDFPEIYTVSPARFAAQYGFHDDESVAYIRKRYSYTNDWHTDVTPVVNPPAASVLRADVVPEFGGDTTFTNLVAAYEGLSAPFRQFLDGLRAEHRYGAGLARKGNAIDPSIGGRKLVSHHPVVRVHPLTGERGLFVSPGFTSRILGLSEEESRDILNFLFAHITKPTYTVRFRWAPGSVAFWDNRATSHLGPQDIDHLDVERVLHRTTIIGEIPVGVDGRESVSIEGGLFEAIPLFR
ncbi:MAG: TauD/TfdA family dioxygenase [Actinomycetes bacterium]